MATIALIEKGSDSIAALAAALQQVGHQVMLHADGASALAAFRTAAPDLILVALRAPGVNGHEILRHARRIAPVPVVLISPRCDEIDEMVALKLGADDFLGGPLSLAVVVARVEAILRRVQRPRQADKAASAADGPQSYGGMTYDANSRSCRLDGHPVDLTALEAVMLGALFFKPGAVLSRSQLIDRLYGLDADIDPRIVDSYVKRLRIKFRVASPNFDPIETIYRAGYRLRAPRGNAAPSNPPKSMGIRKDSEQIR